MSPLEVINLTADICREFGFIGMGSYLSYIKMLNAPNTKPVYIIESIKYDKNGYATDIQGHIEIPPTYRDYVAKGGLGIPVYEAGTPNEFGVIFGRQANLAVRNGVIVKINPLEDANIYYVKLRSVAYDSVVSASVLFQTYEHIRTSYLKNMLVELEGMILNSSSKDVILESIRKFKEQNKNNFKTDEELLINFMQANESYLEELNKSNEEAKRRIKEGKEFIEVIENASATAMLNCTKVFAEIAAEIALISVIAAKEVSRSGGDPASLIVGSVRASAKAAALTAAFAIKHIPKNSKIKFLDLQQIDLYNQYRMRKYNKNLKDNNELWKKTNSIINKLKLNNSF